MLLLLIEFDFRFVLCGVEAYVRTPDGVICFVLHRGLRHILVVFRDNDDVTLVDFRAKQGDELEAKDKEIERLRKKLEKYNPTELEEESSEEAEPKKVAKKPGRKPKAKKE